MTKMTKTALKACRVALRSIDLSVASLAKPELLFVASASLIFGVVGLRARRGQPSLDAAPEAVEAAPEAVEAAPAAAATTPPRYSPVASKGDADAAAVAAAVADALRVARLEHARALEDALAEAEAEAQLALIDVLEKKAVEMRAAVESEAAATERLALSQASLADTEERLAASEAARLDAEARLAATEEALDEARARAEAETLIEVAAAQAAAAQDAERLVSRAKGEAEREIAAVKIAEWERRVSQRREHDAALKKAVWGAHRVHETGGKAAPKKGVKRTALAGKENGAGDAPLALEH